MVPSLLCIFPPAKCLFKHNNPLVEYAKDTTFVDSREFGRWMINLHPTPLVGWKLQLQCCVSTTSYNPQSHNNYTFKMHFRTWTLLANLRRHLQAFNNSSLGLFQSREWYFTQPRQAPLIQYSVLSIRTLMLNNQHESISIVMFCQNRHQMYVYVLYCASQ